MLSQKNYSSFDIIMLSCVFFRHKETIKQLEEEILENLPEIFKRPAADEVASNSLHTTIHNYPSYSSPVKHSRGFCWSLQKNGIFCTCQLSQICEK